MSDQATAEMKQSIRNFEQKTMNRSMTDLLVFDGLADYLLECCSAEAKANTLSLCSLLPLIVTAILVSGPSRTAFLLVGISILLHQILDIANKKQAYRLQTFSFGTYYFDHMCDSISCLLIVYLMGTLLMLPNNWLWFCIFCFGILPFYVHHLTMYYSQYMCFPLISAASEGLLFLELICLFGLFAPWLYSSSVGSITVAGLIIILAAVWLLIFLAMDLKDIFANRHKFSDQFPLKNLFVGLVLGYVMFENAIIEPQILKNSDLAFGLFFYSIILCFTILIGELVLSYGTNQKFHQISLNTLFVTGFLTFSYAVCAVIGFDDPALKTVGVILGVILAGVETVYYGVRGRQIMLIINDAINTEAF